MTDESTASVALDGETRVFPSEVDKKHAALTVAIQRRVQLMLRPGSERTMADQYESIAEIEQATWALIAAARAQGREEGLEEARNAVRAAMRHAGGRWEEWGERAETVRDELEKTIGGRKS